MYYDEKSTRNKFWESLFAHPLLLPAIPPGVRVFGRRKQNLRVPRRWGGDHIWVRFTPKLHHVLIKSIRMLDTLSFSTNEIETITKESIRSNPRSLQKCMTAVLFPQSLKSYWILKRSDVMISSIDSSSLMMTRRFTKVFVVVLSETARCWRCKDDAWSLVWHISLPMFGD